MATRNIVLTEPQDDLVRRLAASEALRAGLRLLEHEEEAALELRQHLMQGLEQAHWDEFAAGAAISHNCAVLLPERAGSTLHRRASRDLSA